MIASARTVGAEHRDAHLLCAAASCTTVPHQAHRSDCSSELGLGRGCACPLAAHAASLSVAMPLAPARLLLIGFGRQVH